MCSSDLWVVPAGQPDVDSHAVERFVEKPGTEIARRLMSAGAMWNAFLLAAKGAALTHLFERHLPELYAPLAARPRSRGEGRSARSFESLPSRDFSHDLLTPAAAGLRVIRVPACGWTDLGTPARLFEWLASHGAPVEAGGSGSA